MAPEGIIGINEEPYDLAAIVDPGGKGGRGAGDIKGREHVSVF
jgi:hypothetical protein